MVYHILVATMYICRRRHVVVWYCWMVECMWVCEGRLWMAHRHGRWVWRHRILSNKTTSLIERHSGGLMIMERGSQKTRRRLGVFMRAKWGWQTVVMSGRGVGRLDSGRSAARRRVGTATSIGSSPSGTRHRRIGQGSTFATMHGIRRCSQTTFPVRWL